LKFFLLFIFIYLFIKPLVAKIPLYKYNLPGQQRRGAHNLYTDKKIAQTIPQPQTPQSETCKPLHNIAINSQSQQEKENPQEAEIHQ